jgi:prepilin peptidase CpaA
MDLLNSLRPDDPPAVINIATLLALLAIAMWFDIRARRIPNRLVLLGLATSFLTQGLLGTGGVPAWGLGMLSGLGLLLPLYLIRAMGAGDVKLMAMVGSFVGPTSALSIFISALIAGGVLAILVSIRKGVMVQTLKNVQLMMSLTLFRSLAERRMSVQVPSGSAADLPYAVAIAAGTLLHLLLIQSGSSLL